MAVTDQRLSVLEIINEVRLKTKLNVVTTVAADSDSLTKLKYLNDVVSEVSDYDNWQETLRPVTVTAQSGVSTYELSANLETQVSATVIENLHEVVYAGQTAEMIKISLDDLRRLQRVGSTGTPRQWAVNGTDSSGNPKFGTYPIPGDNEDGEVFTVQAYIKPPIYVTADGATIPPFPGRLLVQGLHAATVLDESDGEPGSRYQLVRSVFDDMLEQTYNRYNGDTGSTTYFRPARGRR